MPKEKVRLDKWLVSSGLASTRERARSLILAGRVSVAGRRVDKPGAQIDPADPVALAEPDHPYVSRGGVKLEGALRAFGISVQGRTALDVGASTGGFTHCLLLHGARKVYAVDVGYGQFAWKLRTDPRVVLFERTHIRDLDRSRLVEPVDLAVIDVSFISLKKVLPWVRPLVRPGGGILCLVKPQFEVGKGRVGKGGVVRDPALHREVLEGLERFASNQGLERIGIEPSCLLGPEGNREFFLFLRNGKADVSSGPSREGGSGDVPV